MTILMSHLKPVKKIVKKFVIDDLVVLTYTLRNFQNLTRLKISPEKNEGKDWGSLRGERYSFSTIKQELYFNVFRRKENPKR